MEADGSFVDDRREEGERPDGNKPAESQGEIDAGVCILEATSAISQNAVDMRATATLVITDTVDIKKQQRWFQKFHAAVIAKNNFHSINGLQQADARLQKFTEQDNATQCFSIVIVCNYIMRNIIRNKNVQMSINTWNRNKISVKKK